MSVIKQKMKESSILAREQEIAEYEFNVDNYQKMLDLMQSDEELAETKTHIELLLSTTKLELKKAKIFLAATESLNYD